jgi:hypothetical protein
VGVEGGRRVDIPKEIIIGTFKLLKNIAILKS